MKKMTYKLANGMSVELTMSDMARIGEDYERLCTQEYLVDTYEMSEEKAWQVACKVRDYMLDYEVSEEVAIEEVMANI